MARKITQIEFDNTDNDDPKLIKARFKAYRQAMGMTISAVDAAVGIKKASAFERHDGPMALTYVWRLVHTLDIDPGYLFAGDLSKLDVRIARRVKILLDAGITLDDADAQKLIIQNLEGKVAN